MKSTVTTTKASQLISMVCPKIMCDGLVAMPNFKDLMHSRLTLGASSIVQGTSASYDMLTTPVEHCQVYSSNATVPATYQTTTPENSSSAVVTQGTLSWNVEVGEQHTTAVSWELDIEFESPRLSAGP